MKIKRFNHPVIEFIRENKKISDTELQAYGCLKVLGWKIYEGKLGRKQPYGRISGWASHDGDYYKGISYKAPKHRLAIYNKVDFLCETNEIAHSIVSIVSAGVMAKGIQFRGDNDLVELAYKYFDQIDEQQLAEALVGPGDVFVRAFDSKGRWELNGRDITLEMLPPDTIDKEINPNNARQIIEYRQYPTIPVYNELEILEAKGELITEELLISKYYQFRTTDYEDRIKPEDVLHIFLGAPNSVYGAGGILRPLFYILTMYDEDLERLDRIVRFRAAPSLALIGFNSEEEATAAVAALESKPFGPNYNLTLPSGGDVKVIESKGSFPMLETLRFLFEEIVVGANVPMVLMGLTTREQSRAASDNSLFAFSSKCMRYQQLLRRKIKELFLGNGKNGHFKGIFRRLGIEGLDGKGGKEFSVEFPPVFQRNPRDEAIRLASLVEAGILSRHTAQIEAGLDPEVEEEWLEIERKQLALVTPKKKAEFPKKKESDYPNQESLSPPQELRGIINESKR